MSKSGRALYLEAGAQPHVSLDGPALRIRKRCSGDRRFPLGRLCRVVTFGAVRWNSDALSACADAGIVVCQLSPDGMPSDSWLGPTSAKSSFAEDWRHFLGRSEADRRYRQWRVTTRQRAIRLCALQLGVGLQGANGVLRNVRRLASRDASYRAAKRVLYGCAFARTLQELTKLGLSDSDRSLAMIAPDLSATIQWALHPNFCDWRRRHTRATAPDLAHLFERNRSTVAFPLRNALKTLARLMTQEM